MHDQKLCDSRNVMNQALRSMDAIKKQMDALKAENEKLAEENIRLRSVLVDPGFVAPHAFGLTRAESQILAVLMRGGLQSKARLHMATRRPGTVDADLTDPELINVFICFLRKKMKPFGIRVKNIWGEGFLISAEDRQKILDICEAQT